MNDLRQKIVLASATATAALAASLLGVDSAVSQPAEVYCASNNRQRSTCRIDTREGVELVNQSSKGSCDGNWGFERGYVWVEDGCRATFRAARERDVGYERGDRYNRERDRRDSYEQISEIFQEVLDRDVDRREYRRYSRRLQQGWSLSRVRREVARSEEAREEINRIYQEVLGRDADPQGLRTYQNQLADDWSLREVRRDIARSREARERRE